MKALFSQGHHLHVLWGNKVHIGPVMWHAPFVYSTSYLECHFPGTSSPSPFQGWTCWSQEVVAMYLDGTHPLWTRLHLPKCRVCVLFTVYITPSKILTCHDSIVMTKLKSWLPWLDWRHELAKDKFFMRLQGKGTDEALQESKRAHLAKSRHKEWTGTSENSTTEPPTRQTGTSELKRCRVGTRQRGQQDECCMEGAVFRAQGKRWHNTLCSIRTGVW